MTTTCAPSSSPVATTAICPSSCPSFTGVTATVKFRCKLATGKYKFFVYATDAAGNAQSNIATSRLTVR